MILFNYSRKRLLWKKKKNVLFKKLDLVFVYAFIFVIGMAIVLTMTSYLNNKVKEFNQEVVSTGQSQ